jgi:putative flippase GtrA
MKRENVLPTSLMKSLINFMKFILVGGINTGITYSLYLLLLLLMPYMPAYTLSYLIGIILSYYLNSKLVFKESISWKKFIKFPIVYVVQYLISTLLLLISVDYLEISDKIALLISIVVTIPITYGLSKWVIKRNSN